MSTSGKLLNHFSLKNVTLGIRILCENNKIINDTCEVSEKFNTFFSTVADKIGQDIVYDPATHPSIAEIKNHVDVEKNFEFQHIPSDKIEKIIDKINIKKPLDLITFQPKLSNSVNQ
jgi:hypothetical protein